MMTQEEEVVKDHNQEIALEEEEEMIVTERTTMTMIPTERTVPIVRMTIATMGTTHPNPRSNVLPRISSVEQKNQKTTVVMLLCRTKQTFVQSPQKQSLTAVANQVRWDQMWPHH